MSILPLTLQRLECASTRLLDTLGKGHRLAAAALLALTLIAYLPGVFLLPPVDRTEIVYAQSTRGMLERGDLIDASFEGERFAFRPIGIYWMQMVAPKVLGLMVVGRHRHLSLALAGRRHPRRAGDVAADAAAVRRTTRRHRRGAARRIARRRPAGDAVDPGRSAAGRHRHRAAGALAALLRPRPSTRGNAWWLALLFWGAQGIGILAQCARRADPVAVDHRGAVRHGPPRRLAGAAASAHRRAADAGHRRAVDHHPRALRRHPVQRPHVGRVHPRARRRPGHEVEGGAAHLHAGVRARLPPRRAAAGAGADQPVARARRRPAALPARLDRRLLAVSGADRLQARALHGAGDVPGRGRGGGPRPRP